MITKQHLKSRPVCKVTFELSPEYEADTLALIGSFNDWAPVPFKKLKNGKWKLQLELEPGQQMQFRYQGTTGERMWWDNDPAADRQIPNEYGDTNSWIAC